MATEPTIESVLSQAGASRILDDIMDIGAGDYAFFPRVYPPQSSQIVLLIPIVLEDISDLLDIEEEDYEDLGVTPEERERIVAGLSASVASHSNEATSHTRRDRSAEPDTSLS